MTTTIVKSIGTAAGRDFTTIQAWADACPANLVTVDQVWEGQLYNDSEFVVSSSADAYKIDGKTTDATRFLRLTTGPGQSFTDNAGKLTSPLRYDATKGVGIRSTVG